MKSNYGDVSDTLCYNYLSRLIDKLFKVIPLKESGSDTIDTYLSDLIFELNGNNSLLESTSYNPKILDILCTLEAVKTQDMTHAEYRRAIFKCISTVNQLSDYMKDEVNRHAF